MIEHTVVTALEPRAHTVACIGRVIYWTGSNLFSAWQSALRGTKELVALATDSLVPFDSKIALSNTVEIDERYNRLDFICQTKTSTRRVWHAFKKIGKHSFVLAI